MGSACSNPEIAVEGIFDMPGVPARTAQETFCDIEAAPSFIPLFLSTKKVRGKPSEVGFCWLERWRIGGGGEVLLRKTITERSDDPVFKWSAHNEMVQSSFCALVLDFISTYTLTIHPNQPKEEGPEESFTVQWIDAIVSRGILGRILSCCCVSSWKKLWESQTQAYWQYCYKEALRRTQRTKEDMRG